MSLNQRHIAYFLEMLRLHFVLAGFAPHLASHFGKSFSDHSQGYDLSNDFPNCFASYAAIPGSLVNYAGWPARGPGESVAQRFQPGDLCLQFLRVGAMRFKTFALLGNHGFRRVFNEAAVAELAFRFS